MKYPNNVERILKDKSEIWPAMQKYIKVRGCTHEAAYHLVLEEVREYQDWYKPYKNFASWQAAHNRK